MDRQIPKYLAIACRVFGPFARQQLPKHVAWASSKVDDAKICAWNSEDKKNQVYELYKSLDCPGQIILSQKSPYHQIQKELKNPNQFENIKKLF